jgi:hypothetical protein
MLGGLREEYYLGAERRKSVRYEFSAEVEIVESCRGGVSE